MEKRILDLLIGLCVGQYLPLTFVVVGITVHWTLIGLCVTLLLITVKKLCRFLWKQLVKALKKELEK